MKKPFFISKCSLSCLACLVVLFLMAQATTLKAQRTTSPSTVDLCTKDVVGFVDGLIIFACDRKADNHNCSIRKEKCDCAAKTYTGAKGCVDGSGKVWIVDKKVKKKEDPKMKAKTDKPLTPDPAVRTSSDGGDDEKIAAPKVHLLGGETNCHLIAEFGAYISTKDENSQSLMLVSDGKKENTRLDFKPVNRENPLEGFYIITREKEPRAVMVSGTSVSLVNFKNMDGKATQLSQWNFFINGRDKDGNANYILMPQKNPTKLMLVANSTTRRLEMMSDKGDAKKGTSSILPEAKFKNWNCECVF